jgi:predicted transposase YbfD/YdcC
MQVFIDCFGQLPDPRADNARHDLLEVIFVALAATLCGAQDCTDMAAFARSKLDILRQILKLEHGAPSHDTFSRVFRLLKPAPFEAAFAKFMASLSGALKGVIAIDGKALRGAYERGGKNSPMQLVNIWAADTRLAIGQCVAPKRNEALGAQQALALLSLHGCIVTADALHCRADTAQIILEAGGDYALALKANQPTLLAKARQAVETAICFDQAKEPPGKKVHDRLEARTAVVVPVSDIDFPGLVAVARVQTECTRVGTQEPTVCRYFVLCTHLSAQRVLEVARTHWTIENQLHWVLDVALGEDAARSRAEHAPANLAVIRKLALNILRPHPEKSSIKTKTKKAGWNNAFLFSLLGHMR